METDSVACINPKYCPKPMAPVPSPGPGGRATPAPGRAAGPGCPARLTRFSCIFSKAACAGVRLSRQRLFSSSLFLLVPMASSILALSLSFFFFFLGERGPVREAGAGVGLRTDPRAPGPHRFVTPSSATPFSFRGPFCTCS